MSNENKMLVIGVGGAGLNTVNRMVAEKIAGVKYLVMDTDEDDLRKTTVSNKIKLQPEFLSRVEPDLAVGVGRLAILGDEENIANQIKSADTVFIIAGMGGECGSGGAVELARISKDLMIPVVAAAITPFKFEGKNRMVVAEEGITYLHRYASKVVVLHNEDLKYQVHGNLTFANAFSLVDEVVMREVRKIIQEYAQTTT